jgi:hypothetical protein
MNFSVAKPSACLAEALSDGLKTSVSRVFGIFTTFADLSKLLIRTESAIHLPGAMTVKFRPE